MGAAFFALMLLILPFCIDDELYQTGRVYVWLGAFPTLALFYIATMTYLNSKMKQLDDFKAEIRSVRA